MTKSFDLYTIPFKDKLDDGGGFTGEFWGKWFTSAALAFLVTLCLLQGHT